MAIQLEDIVASIKADTSDITAKFNDLKKRVDDFGGEVNKSSSKFGELLKPAAITATGFAITKGITEPMIGFAQSAIDAASQLEQANIAYKTLLGSGEAAQQMMNEMRTFAATTPFEFPELVESGKRLLAMGFTAKQIIPTLTNVGNAVAGVGGNAGVMNRVILAMGQIQAKGQLMAQEMRQLAEAGIPAWEFLANHLKVTIPEAMDLVTKKQVSGAEALTAIQAGMAQKFGGLMAEQSKTVEGLMSNLSDTIGFIMTDIGAEIIKSLNLKEVIGSIREFAEDFLTWFRALDDGTKQAILILTSAFALSGPILVAVGAFMAAMTVITAPMLATGAIITGIVAGTALLIANWTTVKAKAIALWIGIKDGVVNEAKALYLGVKTWLVEKWTAFVAPVQKFADDVLGIFKRLRDQLVGHSEVPDMIEEIGANMKMLDKNMTAPARQAAMGTWQVFRELAGQMDSTSRQISTTMVSLWTSASNTVSSALATQLVRGNDWKSTMESLATSALSTVIQLGMSQLAQRAMVGAAWVAQNGLILASESATATGVVGIWTGASAAITGTFATMTGAISLFFTGTIIPMFTAVGTAVTTFLSAMATALDISIFGAAFSVPVWAAVALVAAATATIAAFAFGAFAEGGIVKGPMMGLVGEAGPEAIIPLDQLGSIMGGGETTVIVELEGRILAKAVFDGMPSVMRLRGMSA